MACITHVAVRRLLPGLRSCLLLRRGISAVDAQRKLQERTSLGINQQFAPGHAEKVAEKRELRGNVVDRPEYLISLTSDIRNDTRAGEFEAGWKRFEEAEGADAALYNVALNLCAKALWPERAWELWNRMPAESKSVVSYSTMMNLCKRCKQSRRAESLFVEMQEAGVQPNIILYNAMIGALAMDRDPSKALERFRSMPADMLKGATLDGQQTTFQAIMTAMARAGDYATTRELFMEMTAAGVPPNNAHYNALMTACARGELNDIAQGVFDSMLAYKIKPDVANWTILMSCNRHNLQRCQEIMQEMHTSTVQPSALSYLELCEAHVNAGDGTGARKLLSDGTKLGNWQDSRKAERLTQMAASLPDSE